MADGNAISPAEAARELLRRRRARGSLVGYSHAITIPGAPVSEDPDEWLFKPIESSVAKHHQVTMEAIDRCIHTDYGRLMIFEPPGSAKSTYASVVGTTYAMGKHPGLRCLMTSYAATPIIRHSKRARQIANSPEFSGIWGCTVVGGSNAADEWELTNGSGMFAAGLMGGLTSSRCDLGIIDDPVAGREEAESETIRKKTRAAYDDDFLTRLKPKASIIIIQTRWAQEDLAGSILPEDYDGRSGPVECRDGQVWEVLNIPAQCERADDPVGREIGEYLWPEWFSERHWQMYKRNARTWSSLYQQRPVPDEGIYMKRENFKRYSQTPDRLRYYETSDFATKKDSGDFTAHVMFGIDTESDIFIETGFNEQVETDKGVSAGIDLVKLYKPQIWIGESGPIESAIGPEVRRQMRKRKTFAARELMPSIADKVSRVRAFAARVSAGTVWVKEGEFGDMLIEQLIAFPAGRYDDLVDCCSLIGRALDLLMDAEPPPAAREKPVIPFSREHIESTERMRAREVQDQQRYYQP
jgi:predicted phage terminase large subunit-like protein